MRRDACRRRLAGPGSGERRNGPAKSEALGALAKQLLLGDGIKIRHLRNQSMQTLLHSVESQQKSFVSRQDSYAKNLSVQSSTRANAPPV